MKGIAFMKKVVFTGNTFSDGKIKELAKEGLEIIPKPLDLTEDQVIEALQGAEGYICGGEEIATKKVLQAAKELKIFAFLGAGYERYVDVEAAKELGIVITNTPEANSLTVAEHSVALIMDAIKGITWLNNDTKKRKWQKRQTWNLSGKTIGIIGMGAIGSRVARILHNGFGAQVLYVSRNAKPEIEKELSAKKVELQELLRKSDVVSIHTSYNNDTIGLIGEKELSLMKSEAVLVNAARAEVVDGHALYKALSNDVIASAAYDVYYKEPVPEKEDEYKLLSLPDKKFIITPHTGYSSAEALRKMEDMVLESIKAALEGSEVPNRVG